MTDIWEYTREQCITGTFFSDIFFVYSFRVVLVNFVCFLDQITHAHDVSITLVDQAFLELKSSENRRFAWRHLTTTTRMHFAAIFVVQICVTHERFFTKEDNTKYNSLPRSQTMTSCKWPRARRERFLQRLWRKSRAVAVVASAQDPRLP